MTHQLITISGELGSGKTTIAKMLSETLGYCYYSTGVIQRNLAKEKGITTLRLNELAQKDPSIDKYIDSIYQKKPWGNQPCIIDSRLAFYFLPDSFKIKLKVNLDIATQRIFNEKRPLENYHTSLEAKDFLTQRTELERERFLKTYHVDISDDTLFDLVIDTSHRLPKEICQEILKKIKP